MTEKQKDYAAQFSYRLTPLGQLRFKIGLKFKQFYDPPGQNHDYDAMVDETGKLSPTEVKELLADESKLLAYALSCRLLLTS